MSEELAEIHSKVRLVTWQASLASSRTPVVAVVAVEGEAAIWRARSAALRQSLTV